jgi:hypothetical protein
MFKIPNNKKISVSSSSDVIGNIYRTKNLNFDEQGKIKLAHRTMAVANSADLTDLGSSYVLNVTELDDYKIMIGSDEALYHSNMTGLTANAEFPRFLKDASTGSPTLDSFGRNDAVNWKGTLYVTNGSDIYSFNGTDTWTVFSTGNYEIIEPFVNLDRLACVSGNTINLLDSSANVTTTLTIPSQFAIQSVIWNNYKIYIATADRQAGGNGVIFEWDGLSSSANFGYQIDSIMVMTVAPYKSGCVFVTNKGKVAYYSSGSEQILGYFPIFFKNIAWSITSSLFNNKIGNRGIKVIGDKIYFAVTTSLTTAFQDKDVAIFNDFGGGVWCYDQEVGLYHAYSIGQSQVTRTDNIATGNVNTTTNVITVAGVTVPATGTPVFYKTNDGGSPATSITGIKAGVRYFTIYVSDTTLKLATTYSNAIAGTAIDLTGTGNAAQFLTFHPNYDFGGLAHRVNNIVKADISSLNFVGKHLLDGKFIMNGRVQKGTDTSVQGRAVVCVTQDLVENRGYFITPLLESQQIEDNFLSLTLKWRKLKNEDDKIVIKYRTSETDLPDYLTYYDAFTGNDLVITTANTFTTTKDLSAVEVGNEMEIVSGAGAGYLAHVTDITLDAGTYTVTIDESIQNFTANDKCKAIFQNWTKLDEISTADGENTLGYKSLAIANTSKWIQFKIELRGVETTIEELIINNKTHTPVL